MLYIQKHNPYHQIHLGSVVDPGAEHEGTGLLIEREPVHIQGTHALCQGREVVAHRAIRVKAGPEITETD